MVQEEAELLPPSRKWKSAEILGLTAIRPPPSSARLATRGSAKAR